MIPPFRYAWSSSFAALACLCASASDATSSRMYEVTVETAMPHLEENLRYATTREQRCLSQREIFSAFPMLAHESLKGCKLGDERRGDETSSWTLICTGGHGTTGQALWFLDARRVTGTLSVKLGGKNMTFYQRVTLRPVGECGGQRVQAQLLIASMTCSLDYGLNEILTEAIAAIGRADVQTLHFTSGAIQ